MRAMIYCEISKGGSHSFYLCVNGQDYSLFSQEYRKGVNEYFSKGVSLKDSTNYAKTHKDSTLLKTMTKIPVYIKYIEKEYGIYVFEQTKKRCYKKSATVMPYQQIQEVA